MFNRIKKLEERIERLESAGIKVRSMGDNTWLVDQGEVTEHYNFCGQIRGYRVSTTYILDKILKHLKLELVFNEGIEPSLNLKKRYKQ